MQTLLYIIVITIVLICRHYSIVICTIVFICRHYSVSYSHYSDLDYKDFFGKPMVVLELNSYSSDDYDYF